MGFEGEPSSAPPTPHGAFAPDRGAGLSGSCRVVARLWRDALDLPSDECLAEEVPIAFEYNGISHAVMLATPADLEDLAFGFSLTEGLIDVPDDLLDVDVEPRADGTVLHLQVTARCEARLKSRRRQLAGRTGCGLCGTDSLEHVLRPCVPLPALRVSVCALSRAAQELAGRQPLHRATGATHAAAWCTAQGHLQVVREDVGRHNALDKLAGALARGRADVGAGIIAVTSRASVEMVQKAAAVGVTALAAMSAPTQLAVQVAQRSGLLLAGFVRDGRATVYAGAERLVG